SLVKTVAPVRNNRAATAPPARAASSATASSCAIIPADLKVPRRVKEPCLCLSDKDRSGNSNPIRPSGFARPIEGRGKQLVHSADNQVLGLGRQPCGPAVANQGLVGLVASSRWASL